MTIGQEISTDSKSTRTNLLTRTGRNGSFFHGFHAIRVELVTLREQVEGFFGSSLAPRSGLPTTKDVVADLAPWRALLPESVRYFGRSHVDHTEVRNRCSSSRQWPTPFMQCRGMIVQCRAGSDCSIVVQVVGRRDHPEARQQIDESRHLIRSR
jgi:hypothetical protein